MAYIKKSVECWISSSILGRSKDTYMANQYIFFWFDDSVLFIKFFRNLTPDTHIEEVVAIFHIKCKRLLKQWILK